MPAGNPWGLGTAYPWGLGTARRRPRPCRASAGLMAGALPCGLPIWHKLPPVAAICRTVPAIVKNLCLATADSLCGRAILAPGCLTAEVPSALDVSLLSHEPIVGSELLDKQLLRMQIAHALHPVLGP